MPRPINTAKALTGQRVFAMPLDENFTARSLRYDVEMAILLGANFQSYAKCNGPATRHAQNNYSNSVAIILFLALCAVTSTTQARR
eukprot:scaffold40109_cov19-Prasinocladus_malaysianus.AAC.1